MIHSLLSLFCLLGLLTLGISQDLLYLDEPRWLWSTTFNAIGEGNGLYMTPLKDKVIAVSRSGIVRAYDPMDGNVLWQFSPTALSGGSVSCESGATFVETSSSSFLLAYMVIDTVAGETSTRVFTVDLDGQPIWESASVPGEGAGSPAASADGRFFAITHNHNQRGYFSIFDTTSTTVEPMYQYESDLLVFNSSTPFSAVGVFHNPVEGFYDSAGNNGRSNSNDIFVFMTDTNTDVLNAVGDPQAGSGQIYVFQFPADFFVAEDPSSLAVIPVGSTRSFQAKTAPVLADDGRTMYWNMVRGDVRGWVEQRFSRGQSRTLGLGRGVPAYIAGRASPTLSSDPSGYSVFGPGAGNLVFKADRELLNTTTVETDGIVSGRLAVTHDDLYVAYATHSGTLVLASTSDLSTKWTVSSLNPIKGDIATDDMRIFVGGDQGTGVGQIVAFEMAYLDVVPSSQPTAAPSTTPGEGTAPSFAPTQNGLLSTSAPSVPSSLGTVSPTRSSNTTDTSAGSMLSTVQCLLFIVFVGAVVLA